MSPVNRNNEKTPPSVKWGNEHKFPPKPYYINGNDADDKVGIPAKSDCFVATAVYGSYDCPEVVRLRGFRDNFLKKYALGRAFIAAYYRFGPYLAKIVKGRAFLSTPTKAALDLFIRTFLEKKRP